LEQLLLLKMVFLHHLILGTASGDKNINMFSQKYNF
jgi:hypothetical protein